MRVLFDTTIYQKNGADEGPLLLSFEMATIITSLALMSIVNARSIYKLWSY